MFRVGDSVSLSFCGELKSHHKDLYDEMERKGLEVIQGEVKENDGRVVWIDFSSGSLGGKRGEQYGLLISLLNKISQDAVTPAPQTEF